jgi:hypothetical protein
MLTAPLPGKREEIAHDSARGFRCSGHFDVELRGID